MRRRWLMLGTVAGSMVIGGLVGAVVFAPRSGSAANLAITGSSDDVERVCLGLGEGPIATAAEVIGIDPDALLEALRDGQTIAEVAEENGVEPSKVVDALVAKAEERLSALVDDGVLTQEQADERSADLEELFTAIVNGERPWFGFPGFGPGHGAWRGGWHGWHSEDPAAETAAL